MNLNNLPKDMLVELVSNIRDDVEKEYCNYFVIHADNFFSNVTFEEFKISKKLKEFLLKFLTNNTNRRIIFAEEEIKILESFRLKSYDDYLKHVYSLGNKYSLEDLIEMVIKVRESKPKDGDGSWHIHRIVKGKITYRDRNEYEY